ncbi:MAG: xylulokinase, partial [Ktedonobacterales bacterium]
MSAPGPARFLGIDLGTTSLKVLAAGEDGRVLAVGSCRQPLARPRPGWAEQAPGDWWAALAEALHDLRTHGVSLDALAGIGLTGQMHGLVVLDRHGESLGTCQTWADRRCHAEARAFERRVGRERLLRIAGSRTYTSATAPKLLWLRRHAPERYAATAHVLLPKDYLRWRLTATQATDASDASGTLLCDVATRDWSAELLAALDLPRALLPPVCEANEIVGRVTPEAARALGLPVGVPVAAGGGDAQCAAVGHGLIGADADAGVGLATLGTAGQFFAVTATPVVAGDGALQTLCHAVPGRWHVMRCILAGGSTLEWLAGLFGQAGEGDG